MELLKMLDYLKIENKEKEYLQPPCSVCGVSNLHHLGRRYGLLENCTHVFCLDCIRHYNIRLILSHRRLMLDPNFFVVYCPTCDTSSTCIISNKGFISELFIKLKYLVEYSVLVHDLPCPYFRKGLGVCLCNTNSHFMPENDS